MAQKFRSKPSPSTKTQGQNPAKASRAWTSTPSLSLGTIDPGLAHGSGLDLAHYLKPILWQPLVGATTGKKLDFEAK